MLLLHQSAYIMQILQPKGKSNPYFNGENIKSYHLTIGSIYHIFKYNNIYLAQYKIRTYIYRLQNGYTTIVLTELNKTYILHRYI